MQEACDEQIRNLRSTKKLHSTVESRLAYLLNKAHPDAHTVPEVSAVLGGRNDLLQYFFNGRRVVFEIFCSASQVSQDLRLLEQCDAAVKIAVLIDQDIDETVATEYFRKKPHAFPFLWLKRVLDPRWESIMIARLQELIDEKHSVVRLRRLLQGHNADAVDRAMRQVLDKLESHLPKQTRTTIAPLTGKQVLALQIIALIAKKGFAPNRLRSLYHWLSEAIEYGVEVVSAGFQAFLLTDLESRHAIWSDGDLADDLIICTHDSPSAQMVLCLNPIINNFLMTKGHEAPQLRFHFFHTYAEFIGGIIPATGTGESGSNAKS